MNGGWAESRIQHGISSKMVNTARNKNSVCKHLQFNLEEKLSWTFDSLEE